MEAKKARKNESLDDFWTRHDGPLLRRVTAVIVGAGSRGENYSEFALDFPSRMEIVAVAEPNVGRRRRMQDKFNIADGNAFSDSKDLATAKKMADVAIITTQDRMHKEALPDDRNL
jgi:predicted dehydrogenase